MRCNTAARDAPGGPEQATDHAEHSAGQKRLTNIAVVRLKKTGKRFEIACYKNKVMNWRQGVEDDIDEVLQTTEIFQNVGKGSFAQNEDLMNAFGTLDREAICREILARGDLQVSEKERKLEQETKFKDVASVIVEKCVNPDTQRPYTMGLIERALKDIHFAVDPKHSAKQQALEAIPLLQAKFPIQRALMRLDLTVSMTFHRDLVEELTRVHAEVEAQDMMDDSFTATVLIQPGTFRAMHNFMMQSTCGTGRIDVVDVSVQEGAATEAMGAAGGAAHQAAPAAEAHQVAAEGLDGSFRGIRIDENDPSARPAPSAAQRSHAPLRPVMAAPRARAEPGGEVVYAKASIGGIPDTWSNRREMFKELDRLQEGWTVELRARGGGDTVDAIFYDPAGAKVGAYATARRQALAASKATAACA